jgi:hypothetical protein
MTTSFASHAFNYRAVYTPQQYTVAGVVICFSKLAPDVVNFTVTDIDVLMRSFLYGPFAVSGNPDVPAVMDDAVCNPDISKSICDTAAEYYSGLVVPAYVQVVDSNILQMGAAALTVEEDPVAAARVVAA